jgi:hypothetical protein
VLQVAGRNKRITLLAAVPGKLVIGTRLQSGKTPIFFLVANHQADAAARLTNRSKIVENNLDG